ncbi:DUF6351 family protein [Chitinophaga sp.]|uniref:DUF6351 family protein n=1 Tax=Chitinophaga sp. TaxID=1869181 RepID=UPI0031E0B238
MVFMLAILMNCMQQVDSIRPHTDSLRNKILALHIEGLVIDSIRDVGAEYCLVAVSLPRDIKVQVWMPQKGWNGRFLGTGNGGSGGKILNDKLAYGLKRGFATANTDLGTSAGVNKSVHDPERWADFGYRATHLMTVVGKQVVTAYYGKPPHHSYFMGCSTGGQQALMEAQRYPEDYNGIIAGAPANNRTHLHTQLLFNYLTTKGLFSNTDFTYLNAAQKAALQKVRNGPVNPRTGEQIYCGIPAGSEQSDGGIGFFGGENLLYPFRWVFGADYDYRGFDFDKDLALIDSLLGPVLNANNPDLDTFKNAGGKLMMYTGTADALVPACDAMQYYERVKDKKEFFRYFLIPGMCHCGGGAGISDIGQNLQTVIKHDILQVMVEWVEDGVVPDKLMGADAQGNLQEIW